jgi:2-phosphosulfolactate phosphatase
MQLEVLFAPAELEGLRERDLTDTLCVVLDILRATSTMVTALTNGAMAIRPVGSIEQALALHRNNPRHLLAGERGGWRIGPELTRGVAFDLGNSPREFTAEAVSGRSIIMTTTNGTRAFEACAGARVVMAGAFLNLGAVAEAIRASGMQKTLLVCSGTGDFPALEDSLAAGALCSLLGVDSEWLDSARLAYAAWLGMERDWVGQIQSSQNGRRLLSHRDLAEDVAFCCHRSLFRIVPMLCEGTELRGFDATSVCGSPVFSGKAAGV